MIRPKRAAANRCSIPRLRDGRRRAWTLESAMMKVISILTVCAICGCGPETRTDASAELTIRNVFQAEIPASVTNAQIQAVSVMTLVIQGRFECDEADLPRLLVGSALLPDQLKAGANPLRPIQHANLPWWRPESLQDASGIECAWEEGSDVANCMLAAGKEPATKRTVVYFMVVYENKSATGHRPKVKADPNWGK